MSRKVLDFELATVAIEKFIKHQESMAALWEKISYTASRDEQFHAVLAKILLDKYHDDGNPVRLLMDILDMEEFYRDLVMQYMIDEGLVYEIMELGIEW